MRNFYFSLLLSSTTMMLSAQTNLVQNGFVRAFNSGKKPVPEVLIIYSNASPATSDQAGKFQLNFTDKKANDLAFRADIARKGFELVNEKELEHLRLSQNNAQLNTDIIVAKIGTISDAQRQYGATIESALKSNFDNEKDALRKALQSRQILKEMYQDQFEALQKHYSLQKREVFRLSDKLARINFDDAQPMYKEMLDLFKEGQMESAIRKIESASLMDGLFTYFKSKKSIKNAADSAQFMAKNGQQLSNNLALIDLQADFYLLSFNKSKAETLYDQMYAFDSTNLDILRGCADFYRINNFNEKALNVYSKILVHPKVDMDFKKQAFIGGGDVLMAMSQVEDAINAYNSAKNIVFQWVNKESKNAPFIKNELSALYLKSGNANLMLGNNDKSMVFFKGIVRLQQEIFEFYPNNVLFKKTMANALERLGKLHTNIGDLAKSIEFYESNKRLRKEIYETDAANLEAKDNLAWACEKLGNTQMSLNVSDKAMPNFDQYFALKNEIFADDRLNIETKNNLALAHFKLGNTYTSLTQFDKALSSFLEYNRVAKELLNDNLNNPDFKNSLALSFTKLAETHLSLGNSNKALQYYEDRLKLNKELVESFPNTVSYKNSLAVIYSKIGNIYNNLGDVDLALAYYMKDADVSKDLFATFPNNAHFKNNLALSFSKLGTFYKEKKNDAKQAHIYFEKSKNLLSELAVNEPNSVDYKNNLRIIQEKLTEK
jgi:tetratricopeptide (TPR) repeat protein